MIEAKNKKTNLIIGRGLITAESVASELRERLARQLGESWRFLSQPELLQKARNILAEFEPILAKDLQATDLAAWLAGFDEVAKQLPPYVQNTFARLMQGPPIPPVGGLWIPSFGDDDEPEIRFPLIEKAADSLFERRILKRSDFDRVSDAAKRDAFTVAGEMSGDALQTIRDTLAETVREGASLDAFRNNLGENLRGSFIGPAHLETVYRTNVQTAFHEGHDELASNPIVADVFPYQAYLAIHDARARPTHIALERLGIEGSNIYRRDDPFWDLFTPAWDFNCRCGVNLMTLEAAARAGLREAREWIRTGNAPPLVSRLPFIPFRPPAGFGARRVAA